jgi:phospholipase C
MTMKRRDAIKTLGALAGAASTAKLLSACGDNLAGDGGITTYVFLMMENRSYDHYLGARSMLEGKPGNGLTSSLSNPDINGDPVAIWQAGADAETQCATDPPHGWSASRTQLNAGANDGFVVAHQRSHGDDASLIDPMQYMTRDRIPVHYALADAYTSCDSWFSSVLGPTLPNRMYWHAATSNGATSNDMVLDGAFDGIPSIHHRMNDIGLDWAYYYGDVPVLGVLKDLDFEGRLRRFLYDFIDDAAAGKLPPVCHIDPGFGSNDDHPPHHPLLGQQLISTVYNALATSPQWKNCMLVVTYDENGGFYDHVAPPTAPDDRASDGFDQLGFRVPALVAGPYIKQGYVSSVQYDHTSALKQIENVFGTEPLTARSTAATDLSDCIDFDRLEAGDAADPIALPAVEIDEAQLPDVCKYNVSFREQYDHDILAWGAANRRKLGDYYRVSESRDYVYGIADYLDHHNLGRIRRGK